MFEFHDRLNRNKISQYQRLLPQFIHDNAELLDVKLVNCFQTLDGRTIETLKNKLDMKTLFQYQEIRGKFMLENILEIEDDENICDALVLNNKVSTMIVNIIFRR